jgi:hypothetical protein
MMLASMLGRLQDELMRFTDVPTDIPGDPDAN